MADIHILTGDGIDNWTVACHYPVADTDNEVSVSYRTAIVNSGLGGTSQMTEGTGPGQITTAELAQIAAGELYEHTISFPAESGATSNAELLTAVRAEYARHNTRVVDRLRRALKYYGWSGSAS
jgi:hypothetical protein